MQSVSCWFSYKRKCKMSQKKLRPVQKQTMEMARVGASFVSPVKKRKFGKNQRIFIKSKQIVDRNIYNVSLHFWAQTFFHHAWQLFYPSCSRMKVSTFFDEQTPFRSNTPRIRDKQQKETNAKEKKCECLFETMTCFCNK